MTGDFLLQIINDKFSTDLCICVSIRNLTRANEFALSQIHKFIILLDSKKKRSK
jgi:hypothetical protein